MDEIFGCPGATLELSPAPVGPPLITRGAYCIIPEDAQPGTYAIEHAGRSRRLTVFPRFVDWTAIPDLPVAFTAPISRWANRIEYNDSADYDTVTGHDFIKSLPEDWGPIVAQYGASRADAILDIGTGTGRLRLSLLKSGYMRVYGLDSSRDCLTRQSEWQSLLGVDSTASPLIHDDDFSPAEHRERFAAVCMSSALHHVADLRGFFQFVATILKPGGHFIVSAEPTNTDRFNRTCGHDTRVDLLDVIEGHRTNRTARSASSVMFAEFWAGVGFNREKLGQIAAEYGMEIVGWDVWQWIGMLLNNHARNHLPTGADAERFASLCQKAQEIDAEIKALMPTFATGNYFNMIAAFRKETH